MMMLISRPDWRAPPLRHASLSRSLARMAVPVKHTRSCCLPIAIRGAAPPAVSLGLSEVLRYHASQRLVQSIWEAMSAQLACCADCITSYHCAKVNGHARSCRTIHPSAHACMHAGDRCHARGRSILVCVAVAV